MIQVKKFDNTHDLNLWLAECEREIIDIKFQFDYEKASHEKYLVIYKIY